MKNSLSRYGQISPVVVCRREDHWEIVDGFKRLRAARALGTFSSLLGRNVDLDIPGAKAAILFLNRVTGLVQELEEARIVRSLVREDGLTQLEVAELLGRHKSWVCRRLALVERLSPDARGDLELGLLTPTSARELSRLPSGNQGEALEVVRRDALTSTEVHGFVDLLLGAQDQEQRQLVIDKPREALARSKGNVPTPVDPRLSTSGNRISRKLTHWISISNDLENWLRTEVPPFPTARDRQILIPRFEELEQRGALLSEAARDWLNRQSIRRG